VLHRDRTDLWKNWTLDKASFITANYLVVLSHRYAAANFLTCRYPSAASFLPHLWNFVPGNRPQLRRLQTTNILIHFCPEESHCVNHRCSQFSSLSKMSATFGFGSAFWEEDSDRLAACRGAQKTLRCCFWEGSSETVSSNGSLPKRISSQWSHGDERLTAQNGGLRNELEPVQTSKEADRAHPFGDHTASSSPQPRRHPRHACGPSLI
jgi:hypothetical protein